jgi:hypothetical protein
MEECVTQTQIDLQLRANRRSFDCASRDKTARGYAKDDTSNRNRLFNLPAIRSIHPGADSRLVYSSSRLDLSMDRAFRVCQSLLKKPVLLKGTASQAAEKSVLLKGTASAVPQVFYLQWGFSPRGTLFISQGTFSASSFSSRCGARYPPGRCPGWYRLAIAPKMRTNWMRGSKNNGSRSLLHTGLTGGGGVCEISF